MSNGRDKFQADQPPTGHAQLGQSPLADMSRRNQDIFQQIVEAYLDTGAPIGSRTLSQSGGMSLSAASIRNVMADLEHAGLLYAPHKSAGRIPTHEGLRLFVDGLLQIGDLSSDERVRIDAELAGAEQARSIEDMLRETTQALSGLSQCASIVAVAPEIADPVDESLKQIEFVHLGSGQALVVIVTQSGRVENRVIEIPFDLPPSALQQAGNFLNARIAGRSLSSVAGYLQEELTRAKAELDRLSAKVVEDGLADLVSSGQAGSNSAASDGLLIVRGHANLLENVTAVEDLERVRQLFADLETKSGMLDLLQAARHADGVRMFIGAENPLFSLSGSSVIISPYKDSKERIIGMIGVIGPTRLNYGRIIPMVDYTAQAISRLLK